MKLQNTFAKGIINKDSDSRFVDSNELTDAENYFVNTVDGSSNGVGKNALGNALKTAYTIAGAKTVGHGKDSSLNLLYNFIKGTTHDYIIEYNTETNLSVIIAQSSTGTLLNFKNGERITNVDIIESDIPYDPILKKGGKLLAFSGDSNPPRVLNINRAKTYGVNGFTADEISVMKPSPIFAPGIVMTTSIDGAENNFVNKKLINIGYRYKYLDGFYSSISSWTKPAFEPNSFKLDYQTYENNGMVNLSNAIDISFKTGPREVSKIELIFKESENDVLYVIDSFDKKELSWADNTTKTFQLSKSKITKVLSEDQYFRDFDNVPLQAVAQTTIVNRLAYANYIEGRDIDVKVDFGVSLASTNPYIGGNTTVISDYTDVVDYSNVIDFESSEDNGGSAPVSQMNFTTNEVNVNMTGATDYLLSLVITPKAGYITTPYTITLKDGATVVASTVNVIGNQTLNYNGSSVKNLKSYITSGLGFFYDCKLTYNLYNNGGVISSKYYYAKYQLSFPKSTGYGSTLAGDIVTKAKSVINISGYQFVSGQQIRINFELQSSLVLETKPSLTFFYNISSSYANLADFITRSSFKSQLEQNFSLTFKNGFISNEGSIVSFTGFKLSYSGSNLTIISPKVVYKVTEDSTIVENKNEFYLINEAAFVTITENSFSSLHSNRDVEACLIYMDEQGRKTTAITSANNTIYIPAANSILVNKLKVTVNSAPPSWAKYYKFGIKQTKKAYETVFGNEVYKDGIYRWIKLVGENKSKVNEGDMLIVKSDYSGPLEYLARTKVLEISVKEQDFIVGNKLANGSDLIESPGLFMKIKQGDFNVEIDQNSFISFLGSGKRRYASESFVTTSPLFGETKDAVFTPYPIKSGSQILFSVSIKAYGSIAFENVFKKQITAQDSYDSIKLWWEAEIENLNDWSDYVTKNLTEWKFNTNQSFSVKPNRNGTASRDIMTDITFDVNFSGGTLVFETEPRENLLTPFYETPETFTITGGAHEFTDHILNDAFDCYAFGNGIESFKIQDALTGKSFTLGSNPKLENKDGYEQVNRYADITYSGVFNSSSNVNRLNEFNLSLANFKDDIDKSYGPIYKIKGIDTNIQICQEDKDSQVFYGKDILYNADGSSNLTRSEQVFGVQDTYNGEFGISTHPESYDVYAGLTFHTDVKRGVVLKKINNGLHEISKNGMRSYFKKLFRDNVINQVLGKYDQYHDVYVLNVKMNNNPNDYVTWVYSDDNNGWLGRITFNPEDMCRVNSKFFSFKNGEIYEHNQSTGRNTFYGIESPSTFSFNFSQLPSERKTYKTVELEATDSWQLLLKTDIDKGFINNSDFVLQEGVHRAYARTSNDVIDSAILSQQGVGNCSVDGLILIFNFDLESEVSIGDQVRDINMLLVGTILGKTARTLTLDTINNLVSGDFVVCSKSQSSESSGLLGYHMEVTATLSKNTKTEVFAVNTETSKSNT